MHVAVVERPLFLSLCKHDVLGDSSDVIGPGLLRWAQIKGRSYRSRYIIGRRYINGRRLRKITLQQPYYRHSFMTKNLCRSYTLLYDTFKIIYAVAVVGYEFLIAISNL